MKMKWINLKSVSIALFCAFLAAPTFAVGQSDSQADATGAGTNGAKAHDDKFIIGPEDKLSINVWKEPDVTRTIQVRSDGKISLPLVGELQAAGNTPLQLEQEITKRLRSYIEEPEVTVMVDQAHIETFNMLGFIAKPGSYPLTRGMTVLDAIAAAGGFKDFAKQKEVYILRQTPNSAESRFPFNYKDVIKGKHTEQNIVLQSHDTIVVP